MDQAECRNGIKEIITVHVFKNNMTQPSQSQSNSNNTLITLSISRVGREKDKSVFVLSRRMSNESASLSTHLFETQRLFVDVKEEGL